MKEKFLLAAIALIAIAGLALSVPTATITAPIITNSATPTFSIEYSADVNLDFNEMSMSCTSGVFSSFITKATSYSGLTINSGDCGSNDGNKMVYLRIKSTDLNIDASTSIIFDSALPSFSNLLPSTDTNNNQPEISFDINDSGSGVDFNSFKAVIDGNTLAYTDFNRTANHFSYILPYKSADKSIAVSVDANDNAGNHSSTSWSFNVDTSPPSISISINSGAAYTNSTSASISISGISSGSCAFKNDSGAYSAFEAFSASKAWTLNSGEGTKTVYAICRDIAGNHSSEAPYSITIDTNAPAISISAPSEGQAFAAGTTVVKLIYSGADSNGSGIKKYYARIDGQDWIDNETAVEREFSGLSAGSHTFQARAMDNADNNSDASRNFSISSSSPGTEDDTTSPAVKIISPLDNSTVYGIVKLKASASDNKGVKKVAFYYGSTLIGNSTTKEGEYYGIEWNTTALNAGKYVITATAYDTSNNSSMDIVTVQVSKTQPSSQSDVNALLAGQLESLKEELEEISSPEGNFGITPSTNAESSKSSVLKELENSSRAVGEKNNTALKESIEKAKALLAELKKNFSIEVVQEEKTAFDFEKTLEALKNSGLYFGLNELEKTAALTKQAKPERKIEIAKVKDFNKSYFKARVLIKFLNTSKTAKKFKVIEAVPKEFAEKAVMVKSISKFSVLKDDPIIVFESSAEAGQAVEITYYLDRTFTDSNKAMLLASEESLKKFSTPPIIANAGAKITTQQESEKGIIISIAIIIIIALLLLVAIIASKITKGKEFGGLERPKSNFKPAKTQRIEDSGVKRKFQKQETEANRKHLSGLRDKGRIEGWD